MFKRCAAGQRIFPSEPAAPSMAPPPACELASLPQGRAMSRPCATTPVTEKL